MYRGRLLVEGTLRLLSPLHVGTGFSLARDEGEGADTAEIACDASGRPVIPGTTLKGILRRTVAWGETADGGNGDALALDLFGRIRDQAGGAPGLLVPYCASLIDPGPTGGRIDTGAGGRARNRPGTYVAARTAVDRASGTAADHSLFEQAVVARGARFKLRLAVFQPIDDFASTAGLALARLLRTLQAHGLSVGRSRGDGWGRLRLESVDGCELVDIDPATGEVRSRDLTSALAAAVRGAAPYAAYRAPHYVLTLSSEEPFFVLGARSEDDREPRRGGKKNRLQALRHDDTHPDLPGPSLMGALRARAEWFRAVSELRQDAPWRDWRFDERNAPRDPVTRLFGETADAVRDARTRGAKRTGWAGLLRLVSIEEEAAPLASLTSVRIDRFSGAPIDRALFETEAFVGTRFQARLALDWRATDEDAAFAKAFFDSLSQGLPRGLSLGHAGNRGFGWFDATVTERSGT